MDYLVGVAKICVADCLNSLSECWFSYLGKGDGNHVRHYTREGTRVEKSL